MISRAKKIYFLLVLIIVGITLALNPIHNYLFGHYYRWPVSEPIEITEGFRLIEDFTVEYESEYIVGIKFKSSVPYECIDGLTYSILENNNTILKVDSTKSFQGGSIGWIFGDSFNASPYIKYTIDFSVQTSIPELKDPKLFVKIHPLIYKKECYIYSYFFGLAQLVFCGLSLIFIIAGGCTLLINWIEKRSSPEPHSYSPGVSIR